MFLKAQEQSKESQFGFFLPCVKNMYWFWPMHSFTTLEGKFLPKNAKSYKINGETARNWFPLSPKVPSLFFKGVTHTSTNKFMVSHIDKAKKLANVLPRKRHGLGMGLIYIKRHESGGVRNGFLCLMESKLCVNTIQKNQQDAGIFIAVSREIHIYISDAEPAAVEFYHRLKCKFF